MSYADKVFISMCKDILENGTSTEGEKVRPHWEDGSSAYTIKKFGVINRYDLSKEFHRLHSLMRFFTVIFTAYPLLTAVLQQKSILL